MSSTLLSMHQDGRGDFSVWLKELGLQDDFFVLYPISKLVEWKWLIPQFRVVFPESFFVDGRDQYPDLPRDMPVVVDAAADAYNPLWDSNWLGDQETDAHWFLHPFFRPDNLSGSLLRTQLPNDGTDLSGMPFQHPNGRTIEPVVDYYFHWQGYALIDAIREADRFNTPILDAPDATERAKKLVEQTERDHWNVTYILTYANRWGGLAEPMTWLSHYRALKRSTDQFQFRHGEQPGRAKRGAIALASHLKISAAQIEDAIKDKFLVLAQNWRWANEKNCRWVSPAWEALRTDIYFAVEWICLLTGKTLDDYLDLWRHAHLGQMQWAQLKFVLPFEYYTDREYFLRQAPYYLKDFNTRLTKKYRLENEHLATVVGGISRKSRHFNSFLSSFRKLHEELGSRPQKPGGIDFRNRSPLDYYLLLAIRAETCFRAELKANDDPKEEDKLDKYLIALANKMRLDSKAVGCFNTNHEQMTKLHYIPPNFIEQISRLVPEKGCSTTPLGQAMLCCLAARNYFAHHDYHDDALLNDKSSQFLLGGILLAVLTLLHGTQPQASDTVESES